MGAINWYKIFEGLVLPVDQDTSPCCIAVDEDRVNEELTKRINKEFLKILNELGAEQKTTEYISISSLCIGDLVKETAYDKSKEAAHGAACDLYTAYRDKKWVPLEEIEKLRKTLEV
jgi:hypothetical protein